MATPKSEYKPRVVDTICPICGENFCPGYEWAYNTGGYHGHQRVCSYPCHLEARRRLDQEHPRCNVSARNSEIYDKYIAGASEASLAKMYGLTKVSIEKIIKNEVTARCGN